MNNTMTARERALDLISFIDASPTAYHAAENAKQRLLDAGFQELDPSVRWTLEPGGAYVVSPAAATIFAFRLSADPKAGFRLVGAHNDSPNYQLKEEAGVTKEGYALLNVEPYGGVIHRTWLDRPLSVAGRVLIRDAEAPDGYRAECVRVDRPLLIIPSLAIHMDREVNKEGEIKASKMLPLWSLAPGAEKPDFMAVLADEIGVARGDILDYDLSLYDVQKGMLIGAHEEFISIGRLDNLAMGHAALVALIESEGADVHQVVALHDNEEIGSFTRRGADSTTLRDLLDRITLALGGDLEDGMAARAKSFMLSCDMAHAVHPNYPDVADATNRPVLNGGPALKMAAARSYITDGEGGARVRLLAENAGVKLQTFHNHSDKRGGATIGSMEEQWLGILSADLGNPTLGMHSVRELVGVEDHSAMIDLMHALFMNKSAR